MLKNGMIRRWVFGNLALIGIALIITEFIFMYITQQNYYENTAQNMESYAATIYSQLEIYQGETTEETATVRSLALREMVEGFPEKDRFEFMLLNSYGEVISTSSGTDASSIVTLEDFELAQEFGDSYTVYRTSSNEKVLSLCLILPYSADDVYALRFVTSLTLVDEELLTILGVSLILLAVVFLIAILSGTYFIRAIVTPLRQIETAASAIAKGDLSVRLPQTDNKKDEVNRLRASINYMARKLNETDQMKNEFISSVSHELRTPLTSIKGWLETIQNIDPSDENYRKGLYIIDTETDRLYDMVEELLDFSRLQNGSFKVKHQLIDLVAELTDVVIFFEARIAQEGLKIVYEEPELPIAIFADPSRLRQVFVNIFDNAIKYSVPGGKITVNIWQGKTKAFIEVLDQGKGIAPEELQQVKTKFFKGKNAVRGSGIGLALVEEIMTALDGTIDISSTLGKGTVVTLGLPLHENKKTNTNKENI